MMRQCFTIICDFDGGTYVSQIRTSDPLDATIRWTELIERERAIPRVAGFIARSCRRSIEGPDFELPALSGLSNVWQINGSVGSKFFTATIVSTAISSDKK